MPQQPQPRPTDSVSAENLSYWYMSRQPLTILCFLLPLIALYEIGLALFLKSEQGTITNIAHETLVNFFRAFGISDTGGLYLGGIAIVVVLLVWHILARAPWRVDTKALGIMAVESALLALPLIALGLLINQKVIQPDAAPPAAGMAAAPFDQLDVWSGLTISVGAGLYEELMFRMLLIALVHTILVDVAKLPHRLGASIAVTVAAIAFTIYHPLFSEVEQVLWASVLFYFLAGLYFGLVYVVRGFGIVVGVHATYDIIIVISMLPSGQSG